jgi:hypothetical protein
MRRWIPILVLLVAIVILPARAVAQATAGVDEGFIFRAQGDVTVAQGEILGGVIVADGNATVAGEVTDILWVISGDAIVEGTVGGDVVVIDGTLTLAQGSTVENITLIDATLNRAEGATVTGDITEQADVFTLGWSAALFTLLMWVGVTIAMIVAVALFAVYGGRQLAAAGETLRQRFGMSFVTALVLWIGLPILAVLAFVTVVGIPFGIAIVMFAMPALWFVGYLVAGAKLGEVTMGAMSGVTQRRWVSAVLGVLALQLIGLIPGIGPVIGLFAGVFGAGALVYWLVGHPSVERPAIAQATPQPAD